MKITLLCKRYYTNKDLLTDKFGRLYHLPVELARLGASVSVFALDYRNTAPMEITSEGVLFKAIPAPLFKLPLGVLSAYREMLNQQPDIVIASGDIHIGLIGMLIARRINSRFVFDVYDYYPAFKTNRIPGMKFMFHSALRNAELVLCASTPLIRRLKHINSRSMLVENGVDLNMFSPMNMGVARDLLGLDQETPVVGYFGSITPQRGPLLIEACRILRNEMPNLRLLMAGRNVNISVTEPWIDYRGELPQSTIPNLIAACNVVAIPYANDEFNSMTGACKIAEYLACGKPVVATRVSGHEESFQLAPDGLCEPNSIDMASAIRRQLSVPKVQSLPESFNWSYIGNELYQALSIVHKTK